MKITFGIFAHVDSGKTTFSDQLLFQAGAVKLPGNVNEQNSLFDCNDIEKERGITVFSEQAVFQLGENTFFLIDTPGHADFSSDVYRTLDIIDYAVMLISGTDGIQPHTETLWNLFHTRNIPVFFFINKLDRDNADYSQVLAQLQERFSPCICDFKSLQDTFDTTDCNPEFPESLVMAAAEEEPAILENYLEGNLDFLRLRPVLLSMIQNCHCYPCMGGSALRGDGIPNFLSLFSSLVNTDYQEDSPLSGRVYKIRHSGDGERLTFLKLTGGHLSVRSLLNTEKVNQIRLYSGHRYTTVSQACAGDLIAVTGISSLKAGEGIGEASNASEHHGSAVLQAKVNFDPAVSIQDILHAFSILEAEEPELQVKWDNSLHQLTIHVMGRIQLEVLTDSLLRRFGITVSFSSPEVLYMETIASPVMGYGHFEPLRHYAEAAIRLEPGNPGSGITFSSECHVDRLPANYQSLIQTHVFEKEHKGILTGSPLTDVHIVLIDGLYHIKHTEGGDFREALYRAIRHGLHKAENILLEPYYRFSIHVPSEYTGKILTDISKYHGDFQPPSTDGEMTEITGTGPASEFMNYGEELAILSHGTGVLALDFDGYRPCHNSDDVIQKTGYQPDHDLEAPASSVFCRKGSAVIVPWEEAEAQMHCLKK